MNLLLVNRVAPFVTLWNMTNQCIHWHRHRQQKCWVCLADTSTDQLQESHRDERILRGISILVPSLVSEYYLYTYGTKTGNGQRQISFTGNDFTPLYRVLYWCAPSLEVYNHIHMFTIYYGWWKIDCWIMSEMPSPSRGRWSLVPGWAFFSKCPPKSVIVH